MYKTEFEYLPSSQNSHLFLAHFLPSGNVASSERNSRVVILVPPFAEEMNRSKRMYVLCARLLAQSGFHAVCFDFSGTGDSSGEWGEFTYSDWLRDLKNVYESMQVQALDVSFIGLRFGALALADAIANNLVTAKECVFWDPIENGEILIRQLVRIKIAAAMADNSKKISTRDVTDIVDRLGYFESGGYHISKVMMKEINAQKLSDSIISVLEKTIVHWMSLGNYKDRNGVKEIKWLPNSFKQAIFNGKQVDKNLHMHPVNDVKFWMQQETTISPALLKKSMEVLTNV